MCFLSIDGKMLDEMMFVDSIKPLQRRLGTKHIKSKTLPFQTLCWQEGGRRAGGGLAPTMLCSKGHPSVEGSNVLVVGPLLG